MECRSDEFMNSGAYSWLWWMAERGGSNQLPDTFEELIAVLNVRRFSNLAKGIHRENGKIKTRFNYEVGHRYPSSKGGKLVAENLVVLPRSVNRTLGNEHGEGLEYFKSASTEYKDKHAFDRAFTQKFKEYSLQLSKYVSAESEDDFTGREAKSPEDVLILEMERLGIEAKGTSINVNEWDVVESKFAELCGGLETIETRNDYDQQEQMVKEFFERQDVVMSEMSKEAQNAIHQPRERSLGDVLKQAEANVKAEQELRQQAEQEQYESRVGRITGRLSALPDDMMPSLSALNNLHWDRYGFWIGGGYSTEPKYEKWHYKIIQLTADALGMDASNWSNGRLIAEMWEQDTIALEY
ncbi:hypothetical protein [Vibrio superstes]|nr:hypothetical protein [Vibrio superstes]